MVENNLVQPDFNRCEIYNIQKQKKNIKNTINEIQEIIQEIILPMKYVFYNDIMKIIFSYLQYDDNQEIDEKLYGLDYCCENEYCNKKVKWFIINKLWQNNYKSFGKIPAYIECGSWPPQLYFKERLLCNRCIDHFYNDNDKMRLIFECSLCCIKYVSCSQLYSPQRKELKNRAHAIEWFHQYDPNNKHYIICKNCHNYKKRKRDIIPFESNKRLKME